MKRIGITLIVVAALVYAFLHWQAKASLPLTEKTYTVAEVIAGDTLKLSNGEIIRLIGVDTPEMNDPERNKRNAERSGADAETVQRFAREAKAFVESYLYENNSRWKHIIVHFDEPREIRLEYDAANSPTNHKDKYGRTLAYILVNVCIGEETYEPKPLGYAGDGSPCSTLQFINLNAQIIKDGYGFAYTRFPFEYMDEFREHEKDARENGRGMWP